MSQDHYSEFSKQFPLFQQKSNKAGVPARRPGRMIGARRRGRAFTCYPWPGLMRCLVVSYAHNLPHLRVAALKLIERNARKVQL